MARRSLLGGKRNNKGRFRANFAAAGDRSDRPVLLRFLVVRAYVVRCGGNPSAIKEQDPSDSQATREYTAQGLGDQESQGGRLFGSSSLIGSKDEKKGGQSAGVAVDTF